MPVVECRYRRRPRRLRCGPGGVRRQFLAAAVVTIYQFHDIIHPLTNSFIHSRMHPSAYPSTRRMVNSHELKSTIPCMFTCRFIICCKQDMDICIQDYNHCRQVLFMQLASHVCMRHFDCVYNHLDGWVDVRVFGVWGLTFG